VLPSDLGSHTRRADASRRPFLSIVITGRNDGYGIDFCDRFLRTVEFNRRELNSHGVRYEFVFVEWGPPPRRPLLADLVRERFGDLDPSVFRWVIVDTAYQPALSLNPRLEYLEFVAKNTGIRRARGDFVLVSSGDVYLGRTILRTLAAETLEERVLYRAPRQDLRLGTDHTHMDWDLLEDVANLDGLPRRLKPPLMAGGTGDFVLLDRATFDELRGFNEVYRLARVGIDHNFLVKAYSQGIEIRHIGGPVYHVNHVGSLRLGPMTYEGREEEAPYGDPRWPAGAVIYDNPPTWGLAEAPARDLGRGRTYLDFSWSAVPPLVDLRRVLLPVNRVGRVQPRHMSRV
jgi:hypothetical protein